MWQSLRNDRLFLVLLAALIALAWISLLVWGQSPYGRYLDHEALTDVTSDRSNHLTLAALLATGYLSVWMVFGAVAHLADLGLHEASEQSEWLDSNNWLIGAGTLFLAGVYQFTPLKYQCLDKCR